MSKHFIIPSSILSYTLSALVFGQEPSAKVDFINGDTITGSIVNMQKDSLEFKSSHFPQNARFNKDSVLSVTFPSKKTELPIDFQQANHVAELNLKGRFGYEDEQGVLRGQITQINDSSIELSTWFAGPLTVDRSLIHSIKILSNDSELYRGPNSLKEWTSSTSQDAWKYGNGALISSTTCGSLAKDVPLPDKAHLSFDLEWKNYLGLSLSFYANAKESPTNYYELRLQNNYMYMQKFLKGERSPQLDRRPNSNLNQPSDSARFDIYMDKKRGEFHVFVDGKKAHTFTDHSPSVDKFGTFLFLRNYSENRMRLNNMIIKKWTNTLLSATDEGAFDQLDGEGQRLLLANGDAVIGKIGKIKDGLLAVETTHTSLQIPLSRIPKINFPSEPNQPKAEIQDIKAYFKEGGWIIIAAERIDEHHIYGMNHAIGEHTFRLDAFEKIDFNIYDRTHNKVRQLNKW